MPPASKRRSRIYKTETNCSRFFIGEPSRSKDPAGQPLQLCLQTVELLFRERTGRLFRNWHKPPESGWFIYLFIFDQDFLLEEKPVNDLPWSH